MRPINNFKEVQAAGDFLKLTEGGYIAEIKAVKDVPDKEYLNVLFDIAEGEFKGYYADLEKRANFWGGTMIRSYKEKALGMFKAFTVAIDDSNGTNFTEQVEKGFKEDALIGKRIGIVLGRERYDKNNGDVGERLVVKSVKSVEDIKNGNFKIPEVTDRTSGKTSAPVDGFAPLNDADLPF